MALYTQEQTDAIKAEEQRVGILAGAGTGKTHTLAGRVVDLLAQGVPPEEIAVFTFTNKAAAELKARLAVHVGDGLERLTVGTFHAVAYSLHPYQPRVITPDEDEALLEKHGLSEEAYRSEKRLRNYVSYNDLMMYLGTQIGLDQIEWSHVIVDEAQDNDELQWEIIDMLVNRGAKLFAVGDTRQSIYEWRGAVASDFVNRIDKQYPLTTTFRFGSEGCDLSNSLASRAKDTSPPLLPPPMHSIPPGEVVISDMNPVDTYLALQEQGATPEEIAILCHTNREVDLFRTELAAEGVPLAMDPRTIKGSIWLEFLRWLACPDFASDRLAEFVENNMRKLVVELGINKHPALAKVLTEKWMQGPGVIQATVEHVCGLIKDKWEGDSEGLDMLDLFIDEVGTQPFREGINALTIEGLQLESQPSGVTVCTVHQAKGLEWPCVIAVDTKYKRKDTEGIRVTYVQATRHTQQLIVCKGYGYLTSCAEMLGFKYTEENLGA